MTKNSRIPKKGEWWLIKSELGNKVRTKCCKITFQPAEDVIDGVKQLYGIKSIESTDESVFGFEIIKKGVYEFDFAAPYDPSGEKTQGEIEAEIMDILRKKAKRFYKNNLEKELGKFSVD